MQEKTTTNSKLWVLIAIVLQLLFTISPILGFGNAPEYDKNIDVLMNISKLQPWILDAWPMPHTESNPSMTDWTLDNETETHPRLVVSSNRIYRTELLRYYLIQRGRNGNQTKELRYMESLFADGHRDYFSGGDGRFFTVDRTKLFLLYAQTTMKNKFEPHLTRFFYNQTDGSLYTYPSMEVRLNIDHEMSHHHQKNWAPFSYTVESIVKNKLTEQNFIFNSDTTNGTLTVWDNTVVLFVYSIIPHRIIAGNSSMRIADQGLHIPYVKMHTVCLTQIDGFIDTNYSKNSALLNNNTNNNSNNTSSSINDIPITGPFKWDPRGQPRGGTPAIRVNETIYGPRYVVIFHSSCKGCNYKGISTYFMGGYIFEVNPPFAITHITSEPIVPNAFYNESFGWAFKNIDYIAFPMGLSINVTSDNMLVAAGKNDQRGWWIEMSLSGFIKSLKTVKTTTILNKFSL